MSTKKSDNAAGLSPETLSEKNPWGYYGGYPIYVSNKWPKKYYAVVDGRKVYFGDARYEQFRDKLGRYSNKDHGDPTRRAQYKSRHEKDRHERGTAGWFADQILW